MITKIILTLILAMSSIFYIIALLNPSFTPTSDMYTNINAYNFIIAIMNAKYIGFIQNISFIYAIYLLWKNKILGTSLLILPFTINIFAFHAFLDGGIFTQGAIMGNILFLINIYYLYINKSKLKELFC